MLEKKPPRVLQIGWDAADWKVINPLLDAGKMPNLQALVDGGTIGNIATLQPALSPTLWTSIATGKRPYKHGIHGFSEPDPVTGGVRPVTNLSRTTKAIWNILNQEEKHTVTVGWWPSHPAEPLSRGVMVSNDYQTAHGTSYDPKKWPLKPGTIYPPRLETALADLRFHPAELTEQDLAPFLPGLKEMTQDELDQAAADPRVQTLMKIIADCTSVHSAATALLTNEPWDLFSVYYDAIDHFGHAFMKYHPPQREGISDWDFRLFNYVTEAAYIYHDMLLGTLFGLARQVDPDVTIILLSDHGFHPDDLRLTNIPNEPAGPAAEHRQFGILVVNGPTIKKDNRIYGASLLDICPTILHLLGLPVGKDMDGKVLLDLYQNPAPIDHVPSWDAISGDHGMHPPDKQISAADSKAALDQLVALGYIDEPDPNQSKAVEQTIRELKYNLAQAWKDGGIFTQAIAILEDLYQRWPLEHRFGFQLALCYQAIGRISEVRATVSTLVERRLQDAQDAQDEYAKLGLDSPEAREKELEEAQNQPEHEQQRLARDRRHLLARCRPNLFALRYLEATADVAEKNYPAALSKLQDLDDDFGSRRQALTLRGEVLARLQRWDEAETAYQDALAIDPESPGALLGLARINLARRRFSTAVRHARSSVGLLYFQPRAHYLIGLAHYRMGDFSAAADAFQLTVHQSPLAAAAWRMLAQLAQFHQQDANHLLYFRQQLQAARQRIRTLREEQTNPQVGPVQPGPVLPLRPLEVPDDFLDHHSPDTVITIVSGLPRSGTSLMMQILQAAGLPIFTDNQRTADDSNPRGYFENNQVAGLLQNPDRSWLGGAQGHALKVVAPLLAALPLQTTEIDKKHPIKLNYRVLFMERDINEILGSQVVMLGRLGQSRPVGDVAKAYQQQLDFAVGWLKRHQIPTLVVPYTTLVHQPDHLLPEIADFIGASSQIPQMKVVIDPSLHRSRSSPT